MMTILQWELSRRKMTILWWSVGVSALIAMTVLSFLAIKDQAEEFNKAFSDLASSAGSFLGGSDLFSPTGYLSSQIYYITLPLVLIILSVTLATSIMGKDETDTTIELTLSRPVSRSRVLWGKILAWLLAQLTVCAVTYAVTVICVLIADLRIDQWHLLLTHLITFAFSASFGALTLALVAASRLTRRLAAVVAIVLSLGSYIVSSLSGYVDQLKEIAKIMPYHYFDTIALLGGTISRGLILYLVLVFAGCSLLAWVGYNRRDIG